MMNTCHADKNSNTTKATKYTCKDGQILSVRYNSRDCSKGSWHEIEKIAANQCVDWGPTQWYNTNSTDNDRNHCPRDSSLPPSAWQKKECAEGRAKGCATGVPTTPAASDVSTNNTNSTDSVEMFDLLTNDFVQNAKKLHDEFLDGNCGGGDPNGLNWEFPSAVFFVITIVTTIGYGTFAPTTAGGKAFTVIFAFIGIAYFGVVVGMVGNTVVHLIQKTAKCCCHRKEKKYKLSGKKTLLWTILMMCIYIALIGVGAHAAADWDIGDAMYCKNYFFFLQMFFIHIPSCQCFLVFFSILF